MTRGRKLCENDNYLRAKSYFSDLRRIGRSGSPSGAFELIEALADLGASASDVACYLSTEAEIVIEWHDTNAKLPPIIWDSMIDLAVMCIRIGEIRELRKLATLDCDCPQCKRRRAKRPELSIVDVLKAITEADSEKGAENAPK